MKVLARGILKVFGWKVIDEIPDDLPKYIVAVAPHTSWKDFFLGLLVRASIDRKISFLGKKELFSFPFGGLLKWMGGIPVDRKQKTGLVDQVAAIFHSKEKFAIAIAPEGTRRKVTDLKSGFYYMAVKAGVPVIPCLFDYKNKVVHFMLPFYTTSDHHKDLDALWAIYSGVEGAVPERGISGPRIPKKK